MFLFLAGFVFTIGVPSILFFAKDHPENWLLWLLGVPLFLLGALGQLISINGCNKCVVHLFGDA
jgi:hypothetical protein